MADLFDQVSPEPISGCWLWAGTCGHNGYGLVTVGGKGRGVRPAGKRIYAHRAAWIERHGEIGENLFVLHKCDVRACVNPDHLFVGTQRENMHDMQAKGRRVNAQLKGSRHPAAKLSESQALHIKNSNESGVTLAKRFAIGPNMVSRIRLGRAWKHLGNRNANAC